jgi:hypothetical protein
MIDWQPLKNAMAELIGMLIEAAPLFIAETLSQHELAPDKVLTERAYRYRNAPDYRLLAHDTRSLPQLLPRHTKLIMSVRRHRG